MALELNLTKNTNDTIQGTLGKYYARVEYKGTISIGDLAKHMAHHNTAFSKGIIVGLITDLVSCIKELALLGYVIKLDDLGLFKASVDSNGLTLNQGSKISAGIGPQRTDEQIAANPAIQQFTVGAVKMIMQATGETTMEQMTKDASVSFTSKTKALVKSLTGSEATDDENNGGGNNGGSDNGGGNNGGGDNGGGSSTGSDTGGGDDNGGGDNGGGDNGGGDNGDDY